MSGLSEQQRAELTAAMHEAAVLLEPQRRGAIVSALSPVVARMIADALAEQAAKVEAVLEHFYPVIPLTCWTPDQEAAVVISHAALQQAMKRDLRAALASEGTDALAKVRADEGERIALAIEAERARDVYQMDAGVTSEACYYEGSRDAYEYAARIARGDAR